MKKTYGRHQRLWLGLLTMISIFPLMAYSTDGITWPELRATLVTIALIGGGLGLLLISSFKEAVEKVEGKILDFEWFTGNSGVDGKLVTAENHFIHSILLPYGQDESWSKHIKLVLQARVRGGTMEQVKDLGLEIRDRMRFNPELKPWLDLVVTESHGRFKDDIRQNAPMYDGQKTAGENLARIEDFLKERFAPFLAIGGGWFFLGDPYGLDTMWSSVPQEHLGNFLNSLGKKTHGFYPQDRSYLYNEARSEFLELFQHVRTQILQPVAV